MTGVSLAAGTKPGPARPADTRPPAKPAQPAKPAKPKHNEGVTPAGTAVTPESRTRTNPLRKELVEMNNVPATPEVAQPPARLPDLPGCGEPADQAHAQALAIASLSAAAAPATSGLTPIDRAMADTAGQDAVVRIARAGMLRAISRECYAVDQPALPAPLAVRFGPRSMDVTLELETPAEAAEWAVLAAATGTARVDDSLAPDGSRWWIYAATGTWRGFAVTLAAAGRASAVAA